ncbi:hypothetical protein [Bacillus thuringiensis]|uniref:hypothetical protein n=1 Tax=Bacillus thuringiensis TaxID=1428 RepID=UPI0021D655C3|nr:hypothetical protein [Bacillus thuringiensis]MCU7666910.1 hypothetical protein [Bacillus thuringiensis]
MGDLYPYCAKCDTELNEEEKGLNRKYDNLFYPICKNCLGKHTKTIIDIANSENEEVY